MTECQWCSTSLPTGRRRWCSHRCMTAFRRAKRELGPKVIPPFSDQKMRFAYADPPYPGHAWRYRNHPDFGGEVDHAELIAKLDTEYDAWALSTSTRALAGLIKLCPPGIQVAVWVRGFRTTFHARPLDTWEPVIYRGGRALAIRANDEENRRTNVHIERFPSGRRNGLVGSKPPGFWPWMFRLLGAQPADEFTDVFTGTGNGSLAWEAFEKEPPVQSAPLRRYKTRREEVA